ncbi:MAG: hypothetical protein OXJ52_01350, partial [Oligoflexia bacterium]|nr:hypothetical protein [Oligoflexia bacterium]
LAVISFLLAVFLIFFSNFLYKKLTICLEYLQELKRFKRELIFKGINTRTVLRRLRLLKQRGFIYSSEGLPNGALAWVLSKKSAGFFKHDLETKIINKNTLQHDIAVSSLRIQLEKLKIAESWISEHILKKEAIKSHYEDRRNSYMDEPPIVKEEWTEKSLLSGTGLYQRFSFKVQDL